MLVQSFESGTSVACTICKLKTTLVLTRCCLSPQLSVLAVSRYSRLSLTAANSNQRLVARSDSFDRLLAKNQEVLYGTKACNASSRRSSLQQAGGPDHESDSTTTVSKEDGEGNVKTSMLARKASRKVWDG